MALCEPDWLHYGRGVLDLAFTPDRAAPEPVYRQLERYLQELLRARRLAPGERLPASRDLAASLGLSRNTVNQAYQALVEQGLLRAHVGQGTFVAGRAEGASLRAAPDALPRALAWEGLLARRARAMAPPRGFFAYAGPRRIEFDCAPGRVDTSLFPRAAWKRASTRALTRLSALAEATDPRGYAPLREAIARALLARGIACDADEVAIVNGAQQALDLVARVLIDPGDAVAIEQPGYFGAATGLPRQRGAPRRCRRRRRGPAHRRARAHPARAARQAPLHHAGRAVADRGRALAGRAAASCSRWPTSTSSRSSRTTTTASCGTGRPRRR